MPEQLMYLQATAAAAIVSTVVLLATSVIRRPASATWLHSMCVVAVGVGLLAGYSVLGMRLAWPPLNALDRLVMIGFPLAVGVELCAGSSRVPSRFAWLMRLGLAATLPRILLHRSVYLSGSDASPWQAVVAMAVCAVLLAAIWSLLFWLSQRSPGVSISVPLVLAILCAGVTIMMAGYLRGGAAAFPLAGALLATTVGGCWVARRSGATEFPGMSALVGIGIVGLFSMLFIGSFFGRLSTLSSVVMLLAPLLCWVSEMPHLRHQPPWLVATIRLLLVAVPLLIVLSMSKQRFDREMAPLLGGAPAPSTSRP